MLCAFLILLRQLITQFLLARKAKIAAIDMNVVGRIIIGLVMENFKGFEKLKCEEIFESILVKVEL